jgi:hypothetical protein
MKMLSGDRNQCQGCKHYFNSTLAFDKHRRGEYGHNRRCLTSEEMTEKGMSVNKDGYWITKAMPVAVLDKKQSSQIT